MARWLLIRLLQELDFKVPLCAKLGGNLCLEDTSSGSKVALKAL